MAATRMAAATSNNFIYGYPTPGLQTPSGTTVMDSIFFLSEEEWQQARSKEEFDYIVVGSGFCALAFVSQILKNSDKPARILVLERGPFFLAEHFQALPQPFQYSVGGLSETFPWTLSARTARGGKYIKWQHGMVPFFGGRSTTWSAWCPRPTPDEMVGWPEDVIDAANQYFDAAEQLLCVIPTNEIGDSCKRAVFGLLQQQLKERLDKGLQKIISATRAIYAPLAVRDPNPYGLDYIKFSTVGPMLNLAAANPTLKIVNCCIVSRIGRQGSTPTVLETSRGVVNIGNAKLILAMGTVPPATLVLNSFPEIENVGKRLTAHFVSSIVARVPRDEYPFGCSLDKDKLELSAIYIAGVNPKNKHHQFHIQLTALYDEDPDRNAAAAFRYMPDVVATASMEQLQSSKGYVIFVCAVLGELQNQNPDSWVKKSEGNDLTTNVLLQVVESKEDSELWDVMEEATFQALEEVLSPEQRRECVEYWHSDSGGGSWKHERPHPDGIRAPGLVHEGSTMPIGTTPEAVVDLTYKLNGAENVYVTGGSLFPKSGSWNPTLTMVALSQHLADQLEKLRIG